MNYCGLEFDIVRASDKLPIYSKEDSNRTLHYCTVEGMEYFLSFRATQKFLDTPFHFARGFIGEREG